MNMNVNLIGGAQGAQGAAPAGTANAADAALFQNLMTAALMQKGGAATQEAALTGAGNSDMPESADIGLLMKLLLGGVISETNALGDSEAITVDSLLAAVAGTSAEELTAAQGAPDAAEAAELLAGIGAVLDALSAVGAGVSAAAADASVNSTAVETLIANGEAANTSPSADFAGALRSFVTDAEIGRLTAESAEIAKAVHVELPRADILQQGALHSDDGETLAPNAETGVMQDAAGTVRTPDVFVTGAARTENAETALGAARESVGAYDAAGAAAQGAVTASAAETVARAQAGDKAVSSPAPYSQIANEIFAALANKNVPAVLSVQLEPAELGRIDVSLKLTSAGKLVIDIAAESAKTQALLAGRTDRLIQALGLQNVQVESVSTAGQTVFSGQHSAWGYADRNMAFFMDLAGNGGAGEGADRNGHGEHLQNGQTVAGVPEEGISEKAARYARRLDLTA
ncbi:MAG: flagellar hook-length control protein FliK [Clostridiales Family XIII bacterium]|jgi:flagellar hook-length control protein FliK|nr:flagellar hook-length control protein FliK [Clostridiales Family XIII bacterium]